MSLSLLKLRSAVLRTAVIGKLSLEWPQAPFLWAFAEIFPKEGNVEILLQVADDTMQTDVHKALYPFYTKMNCSILRQYSQTQKIRFVGSNSQVYCDKI